MQFVNHTIQTKALNDDTFFFFYHRTQFRGWLARFLLFLFFFLWESYAIFHTHSSLTLDWFAWLFLTMLMSVSPLRSRAQRWRRRRRATAPEQQTTCFTFDDTGFQVHDGLNNDSYTYSYRELDRLRDTSRYLYLCTKWRPHVLDKSDFEVGTAEALVPFLQQKLRENRCARRQQS